MLTEKFKKVPFPFIYTWDIDNIVSKFTKTIHIQNNKSQIYRELSGDPVWQNYPSGIAFARNFYESFTQECIQISSLLSELQLKVVENSVILSNSVLLRVFSNHIFDPRKVNLIRVQSGNSVQPHIDKNRSICINIGIKNSSTCDTLVGDDTVDNFWNSNIDKYTMNDSDVYILNVKRPHAVVSNISLVDNLSRYIITYTLMN
jgi:hypothetical protein